MNISSLFARFFAEPVSESCVPIEFAAALARHAAPIIAKFGGRLVEPLPDDPQAAGEGDKGRRWGPFVGKARPPNARARLHAFVINTERSEVSWVRGF
jgi:hypothetical protein